MFAKCFVIFYRGMPYKFLPSSFVLYLIKAKNHDRLECVSESNSALEPYTEI